jgi:hypothetical protein
VRLKLEHIVPFIFQAKVYETEWIKFQASIKTNGTVTINGFIFPIPLTSSIKIWNDLLPNTVIKCMQ